MPEVLFNLSDTTTITKEFILSRISEEEIFEHYGVRIQKGLFCSKLRNDKHPTVSLYRNKSGRLIMHDFGDNTYTDCFAFVQALYNTSYYMALQIIANDFKLINRKDLPKHKAKLEYSGAKVKETKTADIRVEIREWDDIDLQWWGKYGISKETLKKFKVFPCKTVWLNGNVFFVFNGKERCYGYFGGVKEGIEYWRIYFPYKKKFRFINNWKASQIQGAHMLPKEGGEYLVFTKSLKDVMTLYEYGITAIAPCSENLFVSETQYKKLQNKFWKRILLYDNDIPGVSAMAKIKKKYPDLKVMFLPRHGGDKDISDYRKAHGYKKTLELIEQSKNSYEKERTVS